MPGHHVTACLPSKSSGTEPLSTPPHTTSPTRIVRPSPNTHDSTGCLVQSFHFCPDGLKGLQVFEIYHYRPIAERFCDVARTVNIFCECNVAKTFCNRPYSAAKGEKPAQSAYLPFSERLMKNLATPFKPFSQTLYPGLNSKLEGLVIAQKFVF